MTYETRVMDFDFGMKRGVQVRTQLACGHLLQRAVSFEKSDAGKELEQYAAQSLQRKLKFDVETHDCATFERNETIRKVTARLSQGLTR